MTPDAVISSALRSNVRVHNFWQLNRKSPEESRYNNPNPPKPVLPENFEFLAVKRSVVIKKEKDNKEQYMDLLLEADPSKEIIQNYLKDGKLLVLTYKDEIACVAVVTKVDENTCELKNIATVEKLSRTNRNKRK